MPRHFQFSLRALLVMMAIVAAGCAIWIKLSGPVKVSIVLIAIALAVWIFFVGLFVAYGQFVKAVCLKPADRRLATKGKPRRDD